VAASIAGTDAGAPASPRPVALVAPADASPLRPLVDETLGLVRERAGLEKAITHLEPLARSETSVADPALVALLIAKAALRREESRGGHWRRDFPDRSAGWQCRLVQHLDATGQPVCTRSVA
jgi:L-aspartate oxidase